MQHYNQILFTKEFGIKFGAPEDDVIEEYSKENYTLDLHPKNSIFYELMYDNVDKFSKLVSRENVNKKVDSPFYPNRYNLLELCCFHGSPKCFKYLRTKFNMEITDNCIYYSFLSGSTYIANECMKVFTPNATCMRYAILAHNVELTTFLNKNYHVPYDPYSSAEFNDYVTLCLYIEETNYYNIPFIHSFEFGNPKLIDFLFSKVTNINAKDVIGVTALHTCADCNNKEMLKLIISKGANLNARDRYKETPLTMAVRNSYYEIIEILVKNGADINIKDCYTNLPVLRDVVRTGNSTNKDTCLLHVAVM